MTENSEAILSLRNITKVFDHDIFKAKETAVDNLTIDLRAGRCTGLLGHNGAGKTTTIKVILGLIAPTEGKIFFQGKAFSRKHLAAIGYMPEINKLSPLLTPFETLDNQMSLYNFKPQMKKKDYILKILKDVGLQDQVHKRISKLSKGQGRRLGFAYAFAHVPQLLILDEPFSGMDPIGRDFMVRSIESLRAKGASILLCTHEIEAAKKLCDDILILRDGAKVYDSQQGVDGQGGIKNSENIHYQLILSGVSGEDLNALAESASLKLPEEHDANEFLHELVFHDFEVASAWLKACTAKSYTILEFRELRQSFGENEDLLKYLRRDNS